MLLLGFAVRCPALRWCHTGLLRYVRYCCGLATCIAIRACYEVSGTERCPVLATRGPVLRESGGYQEEEDYDDASSSGAEGEEEEEGARRVRRGTGGGGVEESEDDASVEEVALLCCVRSVLTLEHGPMRLLCGIRCGPRLWSCALAVRCPVTDSSMEEESIGRGRRRKAGSMSLWSYTFAMARLALLTSAAYGHRLPSPWS
eukprot:1085906-Rhodomonas_salina.5